MLSEEASFLVLDMLRDVARPDAPARGFDERPAVAWKTGTSFGFRDAWSVGIVGDYVLAVWVGNFDGSANPALVGREAAAPLFFAIADSLPESRPWWAVRDQSPGPPGALNLRQVEVCATTGDLPGLHCPRTTRSWFIPGVSPIRVSTVYRAIDIDRRTGLRSCEPHDHTERVVYEFWPSNLHDVFRRAGIAIRRPPPWSPDCGLDETSATGLAPRIRSPQRSLVYHAAAPSTEEGSVPFSAVVDGDARGCSGSSTTAWSPARSPARATSGRRGRGASPCASWTTSAAQPPRRSACGPFRDSEPRGRPQPQAVCSSTARHAASNAASISAVASESVLAMEIRPNCARPISWGASPSSQSGSSSAR